MPSSKLAFDATAVRKLVRQRVDETSIREVADEVGMSKSGLDSFLKGRDPYSRNRTKLVAWFARQRHPTSRSVDRSEVDAAIALLERYLDSANDDLRERRVREVTARLFKAEPAQKPARKAPG